MGTKLTCTDIDELLISDHANLRESLDAEEHMGRCKQCRSLVQALQKMAESPPPADGQVERVQAMIAERLRPIRPLAPARFFLGSLRNDFSRCGGDRLNRAEYGWLGRAQWDAADRGFCHRGQRAQSSWRLP